MQNKLKILFFSLLILSVSLVVIFYFYKANQQKNIFHSIDVDNLLSDDYSLREAEGEKIDAILEENGLARPTYGDPTTYIKLNDTYQLTGFDYSYLHVTEEEYDTAMKHNFRVGLVPPEKIDINLYSTKIGEKLEVDPSTIEVEEGSLETNPRGFTFDVVCTETQQRANVSVSTRGVVVSPYESTPTVDPNAPWIGMELAQ